MRLAFAARGLELRAIPDVVELLIVAPRVRIQVHHCIGAMVYIPQQIGKQAMSMFRDIEIEIASCNQ
jgi:hypothetical protein